MRNVYRSWQLSALFQQERRLQNEVQGHKVAARACEAAAERTAKRFALMLLTMVVAVCMGQFGPAAWHQPGLWLFLSALVLAGWFLGRGVWHTYNQLALEERVDALREELRGVRSQILRVQNAPVLEGDYTKGDTDWENTLV